MCWLQVTRTRSTGKSCSVRRPLSRPLARWYSSFSARLRSSGGTVTRPGRRPKPPPNRRRSPRPATRSSSTERLTSQTATYLVIEKTAASVMPSVANSARSPGAGWLTSVPWKYGTVCMYIAYDTSQGWADVWERRVGTHKYCTQNSFDSGMSLTARTINHKATEWLT